MQASKKPPKKLGRRISGSWSDRDALLMAKYDHRPNGETKTALCRRLDHDHPGEFGNSAEAIKKKLDRLARRRKTERAASLSR